MPPTAVTEILPKLCYDAGRLVAVEHALVEGDPVEGDSPCICAVRLTFESLAVIFRAVPEDDTISVAEGGPFPAANEVQVTATDTAPWVDCVGRKVEWAWLLTNQQGYEDAVRMEFRTGHAGVELVVAASGIRLYAFAAVA
jgi:hypothetical protein